MFGQLRTVWTSRGRPQAEDMGTGSEQIAVTTEEQGAMVNELACDAEKLAGMAECLARPIADFHNFRDEEDD